MRPVGEFFAAAAWLVCWLVAVAAGCGDPWGLDGGAVLAPQIADLQEAPAGDARVPCVGTCDDGNPCMNDAYCLDGCCVPWGSGPGGSHDGACIKVLAPGVFRPALQCEWTGPAEGDPYPEHKQVLGTPIVYTPPKDVFSGTLGKPAAGLVSWIVFVAYGGLDGHFPSASSNGYIRVIDGKKCAQLWLIDKHKVVGGTTVAVADLDGDAEGLPEIVAFAEGGGLVAFRLNVATKEWELLWHSTEKDGSPNLLAADNHRWTGPTIVDLDGQPGPEVLMGGEVFTSQGVRVGTSLGWKPCNTTGQFAVAVDVDLDGAPELVTGDGVFAWTGSDWVLEPYFTNETNDGYVAIADFGDYPVPGLPENIPEVVVVSSQAGRVMSLDGKPVFGPYPVAGKGGPPTVGDFDSDGKPEFAVAAKNAFAVYDVECAAVPTPPQCEAPGIRWTRLSQDFSSSITGSAVFDFEGDGKAEAVYADECFLRVYDGESGNIVYSRPRSSCTWNEYPVIVDSDGDYRTEIVVGSNTNCDTVMCPELDPAYPGLPCKGPEDCPGGSCVENLCRCTADAQCWVPDSSLACAGPLPGTPGEGNVCRSKHTGRVAGIRIFRDVTDHWVSSRRIWNQHVYYVTNVNDDGTVPLAHQEKKNWLSASLNNFRQNVQGQATAPDATAKTVEVVCAPDGSFELSVLVCNRGASPLAADTPVTFYAGSPPEGSALCTAQTETILAPGECEQVSCSSPPGTGTGLPLYAAADDAGSGDGDSMECNEDNNLAMLPELVCLVE